MDTEYHNYLFRSVNRKCLWTFLEKQVRRTLTTVTPHADVYLIKYSPANHACHPLPSYVQGGGDFVIYADGPVSTYSGLHRVSSDLILRRCSLFVPRRLCTFIFHLYYTVYFFYFFRIVCSTSAKLHVCKH